MKFAYNLIAAAMLATLGLAANAQTAAPAAGPAHTTAAAGEGHGRFDPAKMQERIAKRLGALKQKLQLSGAQEASWNTYVAAVTPTSRHRPDRAEFAKLNTPERIDRMRALRTARMAEMDKRGDATKTFYAALSAEQKKVFDDETARRGYHGKGGRHHRG